MYSPNVLVYPQTAVHCHIRLIGLSPWFRGQFHGVMYSKASTLPEVIGVQNLEVIGWSLVTWPFSQPELSLQPWQNLVERRISDSSEWRWSESNRFIASFWHSRLTVLGLYCMNTFRPSFFPPFASSGIWNNFWETVLILEGQINGYSISIFSVLVQWFLTVSISLWKNDRFEQRLPRGEYIKLSISQAALTFVFAKKCGFKGFIESIFKYQQQALLNGIDPLWVLRNYAIYEFLRFDWRWNAGCVNGWPVRTCILNRKFGL